MATRHRPRRGGGGTGRNVLVTGDRGQYEPQGGSGPEVREGADLAAREYGVPEADIPGGLKHVVNPQAKPTRPPGVPERPADEHKRHGVESGDGPYVTPPTADEISRDDVPRPEKEPQYSDAVPVYLTQGPGKRRKIRTFSPVGRRVLAANAGDGAIRLFNRDPDAVQRWIANENNTAANNILIGDEPTMRAAAELIQTTASETIFGFSIPGNKSAYTLMTQDELWCVNQATAAVTVSWATETEMEEATHGR